MTIPVEDPPSVLPAASTRGLLVSVEGISGVGKTHLTTLLQADLNHTGAGPNVLLEEFSQRPRNHHGDLGRDLVRALIAAAKGDPFLRGGYPATETLLLLAIKMYDYESTTQALDAGYLVLEGRGLHTVAVYQSLITHAQDDHARTEARAILDLACQWRPLPDLTILIADDVTAAVRRAEQRDARAYTTQQWRLHDRAAALYQHLAANDPDRIKVLDRRRVNTDTAVRRMHQWIAQRQHIRGPHPSDD